MRDIISQEGSQGKNLPQSRTTRASPMPFAFPMRAEPSSVPLPNTRLGA